MESCGRERYGVACRSGLPCPVCDAVIEKIRTGSTVGFIYPSCQRLEG